MFKTLGKAARDDPKPSDNGSGEEVPEIKWEWLVVLIPGYEIISPLLNGKKTSEVIKGEPPAASYK